MKKALTLALAFGAALALFGGGGATSDAARRARAQKHGAKTKKAGGGAAKESPAVPKVTVIDEAALKALLGAAAERRRPLLVNFWATWCTPCRDEFPDLVKIDERYRALGLDFAAVSLDEVAELETGVPEFLLSVRAAGLPSYLLNAADSEVAINLVDPAWRGELPATFLYDRQGRQVFRHMGRIKPAELRAAVERTLAEK